MIEKLVEEITQTVKGKVRREERKKIGRHIQDDKYPNHRNPKNREYRRWRLKIIESRIHENVPSLNDLFPD